MKHISSISLLIFTTCTISTMHLYYRLPDHQTITKRLWDAGFSNFAKASKMGAQLGNECLNPDTLWAKISDILTQYKDSYPHIIATWDRTSAEPYPPKCPAEQELIRIALQDYPNAIKALERNQWLESSEKIVGEYIPKNWKK